MERKLPAYPLWVIDPDFSIWSKSDTLNGTDAGGATVQLEMALCFTDAENAIGVATKTSTLNRVKTVTMSRILLSIPSGDGE